MAITLFDLAGAESERRFSPYCWRIRMALAHKGLPVETVPWHFTEKDRIAFSGQGRVPVIRDGERVVSDSPVIAEYLDEAYPDAPPLFGDAAGPGVCRFIGNWTDLVVHGGLVPLIIRDIYDHLWEGDRDYFRRSREERLGQTLEDAARDRAARLPAFRASLEPLRRTLARQDFIAGAAPAYADYIVFGAFQWARAISDFELLAEDDPIRAWRTRLLDAFGGLARRSPGYGG